MYSAYLEILVQQDQSKELRYIQKIQLDIQNQLDELLIEYNSSDDHCHENQIEQMDHSV
jgi:hypothetical protein